MKKFVLILLLVFGLLAFTGKIFGQGLYKWVDEKGTTHFSENPPSSVGNKEKGPPKENGIEILKKSENRPQGMVKNRDSTRIFGLSQTGGST